jgi:putative membrane protein
MMGFGLIWMLLFWGGLILAAVWLMARLFPTTPPSSATGPLGPWSSAKDILDERYARGELSRQEYEVMRQTLRQ